ncbi:hypothetical protein Vafri_9148, partial [Volvox africanus]
AETGAQRATSTDAPVAHTGGGSTVIGSSGDDASVLIKDPLKFSPPVVRGRDGTSGKGRINEEGPMLAHFTGGHRRPDRAADEVVVLRVAAGVAASTAVPLSSWGLVGGFKERICCSGGVFRCAAPQPPAPALLLAARYAIGTRSGCGGCCGGECDTLRSRSSPPTRRTAGGGGNQTAGGTRI